MAIMQRIMDDKTLDKLIELRKCLRSTRTKAMLKQSHQDIERDLKDCLAVLEQMIIKAIRDTNPDTSDDDFE